MALAVILILELTAFFLNMKIKENCKNGMIRLDKDIFCKNLKKYYDPRDIRWDKHPYKVYGSWEEMAKDGPFDFLIAGSSVTLTDWGQLLKDKYGLKIGNAAFKKELNSNFAGPIGLFSLIKNYDKVNGKPSVVLFADITERAAHDYYFLPDVGTELKKPWKFPSQAGRLWQTPLQKFARYIYSTGKLEKEPKALIYDIDGRDEIFFAEDIESLTKAYDYTPEHIARLGKYLKELKEELAGRGADLYLLVFPTKPELYEWLLLKKNILKKGSKRENLNAIKQAAKENGIPILDLEERLLPLAKKAYTETKKLFFTRAETHLNPEANRYAADFIMEFIRQNAGKDE